VCGCVLGVLCYCLTLASAHAHSYCAAFQDCRHCWRCTLNSSGRAVMCIFRQLPPAACHCLGGLPIAAAPPSSLSSRHYQHHHYHHHHHHRDLCRVPPAAAADLHGCVHRQCGMAHWSHASGSARALGSREDPAGVQLRSGECWLACCPCVCPCLWLWLASALVPLSRSPCFLAALSLRH
jgi:hypothetical protein